jgi:N-acetylglucosamine-6-phosphate deacetylase
MSGEGYLIPPFLTRSNTLDTILRGGTILTPYEELIGHQIIINGDTIESIQPVSDGKPDSRSVDLIRADGLWITPGLIDIHSHGAAGSDTMDATPAAIQNFGRFLVQHGITAYLPTTITAAQENIQAAIENLVDFNDPQGARIMGAHLEGPYLNAAYKGAQPEAHLRPAQKNEYLPWIENGVVKLITVAPEIDGVPDLISEGRDKSVAFAVGHSGASYEVMQAAADRGLSQATHLFNGMTGLHHRHPGPVGSVLTDERIFAQVIADGVHLHPAIVKLIIRAKGIERTILISDSMRATGFGNGDYDLGGQIVRVKDGVANLLTGSLAGSTLTLDQAVRNTMAFTSLSFQEVLPMATAVPAKAMGMDDQIGLLKPGAKADLVLFNKNIEVTLVMCNGKIVFQKKEE